MRLAPIRMFAGRWLVHRRVHWPDCRIDRWAERALVLAAGLHLALLALFVAALVSAGAALSESGTQCHGDNLVDKLRRDDPARLEAAMAEADAIPNGKAIFWRLEKPGLPASWLLGTMHSADPRVTEMPAGMREAFAAASTVLIESTETLDREKVAAALMALSEYTLLTDGTTLDQWLPADQLAGLRAAVEARDMPWTVARHMQPWMVAAAIAVPVCEIEAKNAGTPVLDTLIGRSAMEEGKKLVGLETIEEQFSAVAAVPREFHLNALKETLKLGPLADSMMETTKTLYLEGNTALLLPLIRAYAPQTYAGRGYAEFQERLIARRNRLMAERAVRHLEKGNAFMAVGALHLPGENGLVALLRGNGFRVEPVAD